MNHQTRYATPDTTVAGSHLTSSAVTTAMTHASSAEPRAKAVVRTVWSIANAANLVAAPA